MFWISSSILFEKVFFVLACNDRNAENIFSLKFDANCLSTLSLRIYARSSNFGPSLFIRRRAASIIRSVTNESLCYSTPSKVSRVEARTKSGMRVSRYSSAKKLMLPKSLWLRIVSRSKRSYSDSLARFYSLSYVFKSRSIETLHLERSVSLN